MSNNLKNVIFHLPSGFNISAIVLAVTLSRNGFTVFGNDHFIASMKAVNNINVYESNVGATFADVLLTVGDYSKNEERFRCHGNANSVDIDVSALENKTRLKWLAMIMCMLDVELNELQSPVKDSAYGIAKPFLEALRVHKSLVRNRSHDICELDKKERKNSDELTDTFKGMVLSSDVTSRIQKHAKEKPESIFAEWLNDQATY